MAKKVKKLYDFVCEYSELIWGAGLYGKIKRHPTRIGYPPLISVSPYDAGLSA